MLNLICCYKNLNWVTKKDKFSFINQHQDFYTLDFMCRQLKVSRFGFYKWMKKGQPIFNKFSQNDNDLVVKSYLKINGLQATRRKKKFKYGLVSNEFRYPNLLNRNFKAEAMNQKWVTDITYIEGQNQVFYFLSIVKDLWNGEILDWQLSRSLGIEFVLKNLKNAFYKNACPKNVIIHSDQGTHYTGFAWKLICEKFEMKISMSRRGNSPDNGACESWFATFKNETIYNINKNSLTYYELIRIITEYIDFYNFIRPCRGQKVSPIEVRYDSL